VKRILIALALLGLATVVPIIVLAGSKSNPGSSGVSRIEQTFAGRRWGCKPECPSYFLSLTTPADVATVDLVITATIMYQFGRGESARAIFHYASGPIPPIPCCTGLEPTKPFQGAAYRLHAMGGRATATTLTWIKRHMLAAGKTYRLYFQLIPDPGSKSVITRNATFVVEAWSAGN
jgi:hypothetical protein